MQKYLCIKDFYLDNGTRIFTKSKKYEFKEDGYYVTMRTTDDLGEIHGITSYVMNTHFVPFPFYIEVNGRDREIEKRLEDLRFKKLGSSDPIKYYKTYVDNGYSALNDMSNWSTKISKDHLMKGAQKESNVQINLETDASINEGMDEPMKAFWMEIPEEIWCGVQQKAFKLGYSWYKSEQKLRPYTELRPYTDGRLVFSNNGTLLRTSKTDETSKLSLNEFFALQPMKEDIYIGKYKVEYGKDKISAGCFKGVPTYMIVGLRKKLKLVNYYSNESKLKLIVDGIEITEEKLDEIIDQVY